MNYKLLVLLALAFAKRSRRVDFALAKASAMADTACIVGVGEAFASAKASATADT